MGFSLYDAVVTPAILRLNATIVLIDKASEFAGEHNVPEGTLIEARFADDMLGFPFQVRALVMHSRGAINSVKAGTYKSGSDTTPDPQSLDEAKHLLGETVSWLEALSRSEIDALADTPVRYDGKRAFADFSGSAFLMQFALPNFYFHATTIYNLLRWKSVPIGKMDFLGALPFQQKIDA